MSKSTQRLLVTEKVQIPQILLLGRRGLALDSCTDKKPRCYSASHEEAFRCNSQCRIRIRKQENSFNFVVGKIESSLGRKRDIGR